MVDLVSVIMPTYNRANFLDEAMQSVYNQDYRPIELIVVDDGSTDRTSSVVKKWQQRVNNNKDFNIIYIQQKNQGAPAARNRGLEKAQGKYIQFMDSDDIMIEDALKKKQAVFNRGTDIVFGHAVNVDKDLNPIHVYAYEHWDEMPTLAFLANYAIFTGLSMYRNRCFEDPGFQFDESLPCGQERDLNERLYLAGCTFKYVPQTVEKHRTGHEDRISAQNWMRKNPYRYIEMEAKFLDNIRQKDPSLINHQIRYIIAKRLWWRGRQLIQGKKTKEAKRYFKEARAIAPGHQIPQQKKYRLFYKLLGPVFTEWLDKIYEKVRP